MTNQKNWTGERLEPGIFNETAIEHLHRYAMALELVAGKRVLDIACGEGYGTALLSGKAKKITGVDIDKRSIDAASQKYKSPNVEFLTGSVEKIPGAGNQFDVVVSFETIEHISDHEVMLSEIKRVLNSDGLLIISTPNKKNYTDSAATKNPFHVKELYEQEFRSLIQQHFAHVRFLYQQISFSSVISGKDVTGFKSYTGNFTGVSEDKNENNLYCIAIASDQELPQLSNSLFNGRSVFAEAVTEKEQQVIKSLPYKLGNAILYPAKLLRNIFKKTPHD